MKSYELPTQHTTPLLFSSLYLNAFMGEASGVGTVWNYSSLDHLMHTALKTFA
jgi:hypothetical protein